MGAHPQALVGGRFEVLDILGTGGMGVVYRALDRERGVQVAIKTLRGATPEGVLRFKREFRTLRDIRHPNLVELGELFESDGAWAFTMELVRGRRLLGWVSGSDAPTNDSDAPPTEADAGSSEAATLVLRPGQAVVDEPASAAAASVTWDEARLRAAFGGLASALSALHRAGVVHRDVKPSNVLVDDSGRTVLLDFGVASERWQADGLDAGVILGTVTYMAPEQARGEVVTVAADWYAFGVVLYQALAGTLPLAAASSEALVVLKQHARAPDLSRIQPRAPAELAQLCSRLLEIDPRDRAGEDDVFAALGVPRTRDDDAWLPYTTDGELFVGRRAELARLQAAFAARSARYVEITGESGVGKSALVGHFVELVRATRTNTVVLRGRCHERERIAFNAFDGVVHELARWLIARGDAKTAALAPAAIGELVSVFPDLRVVPAFASAQPTATTAADTRARAFAALRELLANLASRRPLVIAIDDLQWADDDSRALLAELREPEHAPAMLVVATAYEPTIAHASVIALSGLANDEATALMRHLAGDCDEQLVADSAGHPLFLSELVRRRERAGSPQRFDDAIRERVAELDDRARSLLEAIALAGAPIAREAAAAVAGLAPTEAAEALARLVRDRLARTSARGEVVEPFHARIAEAIASTTQASRSGQLHRQLADQLARRGAGADEIVEHVVLGDPDKARAALLAAGDDALATCAFARAAELYGRALALARDEAVLAKLADALANAGRSAEAGERYLEAAKLAEPSSDRELDLLRRGAERLLMSGRLELGISTAKAVLARVGMGLPSTRARAVAGIVWNQVRTRASKLTWTPRDAPDPRQLRAEVCWSVGAGLAMVDTLLGAYFSGHAAVLALRYGTPVQIARAMSTATVGAALLGRRDRTDKLLAAARRAAGEDGGVVAAWYARLATCASTFVLDNDFRACLAIARTLEDDWYATGHGPGWETDVARHFTLASMQMLGELAAMAERATAHIDAARRTGDRFGEVTLRVRFAVRHLLRDRVDAARADVDEALASWAPTADTFGNQRAWGLWSKTRIELYAGDTARLAALDGEWRRMKRSLIGRVPVMRVEWYHAYGTYLLGRAVADPQPEPWLREAARYADALAKLAFPLGPPTALMLRAAIACVRGGNRAEPLRAAIAACRARDFHVFAPFLHRRLGEATDDAALIAEADQTARDAGFTDPERAAEMALPSGRFSKN